MLNISNNPNEYPIFNTIRPVGLVVSDPNF